jgi:thioester reductase-like protein
MNKRELDTVHLVTGFPYFRARKVVEHLLRIEPRALVYVVVAPEQARSAEQACGKLEPTARERVVQIEGDVSAIDMGLSAQEYRQLAGRVQRIHHAAQVTHVGADRRIAETVNIGTTREVIELGLACERLDSILVYSSASVSGNRTGLVLEDELNVGQSFRSPVEETLAIAERMARAAMSALPVTVVRPTYVIGDSTTGEVERFDGLYLLILLIVSTPQDFPLLLPTRGDVPLHVVPIDYVVRAAYQIGRQPAAAGRTFHLADPHSLSVRQVFELVAERGGKALPSAFTPTSFARAVLSATGASLLSKSPRALLDLIATRVTYSTANADEMLRGTGVTCPPFESYIDQVVAYVKRRVEERRSRGTAEPEQPADADDSSI